MKDLLLPIYQAVAERRLTKAEALAQIRALKLKAGDRMRGIILATREWRPLPASGAATGTRRPDKLLLWGIAPEVARAAEAGAWERLEPAPAESAAASAVDEVFSRAALRCFDVIRAALAQLSSGAEAVRVLLIVADAPDSMQAAGFEAMFKTAMEENPALVADCVHVPADVGAAELARVVADASVADETRGGAVRYVRTRGALERQVAGWRVIDRHARGDELAAAPVALKEGGCYLITGGAGGIGLQFAREIVRQTTRGRILLADMGPATEALRSPGHRIEHVRLDVSRADEVDALVARLRAEGQALDGVLHCAGILRDHFIIRKSPEEFAAVLAPKVAGLVNLDRATRDERLDFMLLCSSVAACWGNAGQIDYAAANAFMDAFAGHRNRLAERGERAGRALSVNWPLWQDGGMKLDTATRERLQGRTGMQLLATATAMHAFHRGLALPHDQLLVMEGHLPAMLALLEQAPPEQVEPERRVAAPRPAEPAVAAPAAAAPAARVDDDIKVRALDYITQQFSQVLKIPVAKLRPQAPLEQYGIDSILAMKLVTHLEAIFGKLPKTLAFEYQTIAQVNDYFCASHAARLSDLLLPKTAPAQSAGAGARRPGGLPVKAQAPEKRVVRWSAAPPADAAQDARVEAARVEPAAAAAEAARTRARDERDARRPDEPIAIVGLSGRYPEAWDLDEYWRNLSQGKDCIREIPPERWRWQEFYRDVAGGQALAEGQHSSRWGGFIQGADEFDPRFFNITPRDAEQIDPQERLFLQHAWMAIEDAGYTRAGLHELRGGQVGVYAGVMYGEYNRSGSLASIANRVSYVLNLHGPSMTLDTMCSSSLTAIHIACQDLRSGRTDMALAGGVNLSIHPGKYSMLSAGQFISSAGHCQSFGEGGDGYIPGEGVGVVVLKRLADAERDGDAIHAVIRGSALNHAGKTNGYTVPNPQAQAAVISQALKEARVDARHVSYVEAHGTGTKLGDPIEIAAISKAFREHTQDVGFCRIGSAKSNIGHCESAAGVAGLTKVILQMRHGQIVPSLHSARLNPNIDFETTPFVVNQELRAWETPVVDGRPVPRIAGLSSFGAGGSNAHFVVEAYAPRDPAAERVVSGEPAACVVVLSARTLPQLRQRAEALKAAVEAEAELDLPALAYTLQVGREAMDERLGMRVTSRAELIAKLAAFLAHAELEDGALEDDLYYAQTRRHRDMIALFGADQDLQASIDNWFTSGRVSRLLDVWTKGLDVEWRKLYAASLPRRVHLPVYPFARERYWREEKAQAPAVAAAPAHAVHSLVHRNASKPGLQCYRSEFRQDDPRVCGVRLHGVVGLPHALQIEAARAALADALPAPRQGAVWELRDVRFAAPHAVGERAVADIVVMLSGQGQRPSLASPAFELALDGAEAHVCCQGVAASDSDAKAPQLDLAAVTRQASVVFADPRALSEAGRALGIETAPLYQAVESLHRTADGLLLRLAAPEQALTLFADCVVNPAVVEAAMLCAQWLRPASDGLRLPAGFARLRLYPAGAAPRYAWIRPSASARQDDGLSVDLSICGAYGAVLLELRDLELKPAALTAVTMPAHAEPRAAPAVQDADQEPAPAPPPPPRSADVVFRGAAHASLTSAAAPAQDAPVSAPMLAKPHAIALASPEVAPAAARVTPLGKPSLSLATALAGPVSAPAVAAVLHDRGEGIFALRLRPFEGRLEAGLAGAVSQALAHARELPELKLLLIESGDEVFLQGGGAGLEAETQRGLLSALAALPAPTAAILAGRAVGAGLRFACACDLVVAVADQQYGFAAAEGTELGSARDTGLAWLTARFGAPLAALLATSDRLFSGRELGEAGWGATVVPREGLTGAVDALCRSLSDKAPRALRLLKAHLAREFEAGLAASDAPPAGAPAAPLNLGDAREGGAHDAVELQRAGRQVNLRLKSDGAPGDDELLRQLGRALRACRDADVVLLHSDFEHYLPDGAARHADLVRDTLVELTSLRVPVIAVVEHGALNAGLLLALACDLVVYAEQGRYGGLSLHDHRTHLGWVQALVSRHFGAWGQEWVLSGEVYDAHALRRRLPLAHVCPAAEAPSRARRIAEHLLGCAPGLVGHKPAPAAHPGPAAEPEHNPAVPVEPGELALTSSVVRASVDADGVVLVRLEDRDARNMFSDALISGLQEVFERIARLPGGKLVVLVGYDTYFASGGTRQGLKAIQEGKVRFTDLDVFQLGMRCPLPVIAAMQGHGIGAGWTLGLFCDGVVFSEESRYVSPYMSFGFTPGAGATGVLPARLGFDLARESLFTGAELTGATLARRNPLLSVVPRERVLAEALALARKAARHARGDLIAWKAATVAPRLDAWQALFAREVEMHAATLVGQADALARIERRFGPPPASPAGSPTPEVLAPPAPVVAPAAPAAASAPAAPRVEILPVIRRLLAEELRLAETEIDPRTQFVDLGLDSISSVTWIRKINERFGLAIEATKVYSHPNLHKFAQYIGELLPAPAADADRPALPAARATGVVDAPAPGAAPARAQVDLGGVRRTLIALLAQELRQAPETIEPDTGFVALGLDSISSVTWIRAVNQTYGTSIEATKVYTYPTIEKFARFLRELLAQAPTADDPPALGAHPSPVEATGAELGAPGAPAGRPAFDWPALASWRARSGAATLVPEAARPVAHTAEIAVIGMAGRFPMARDVDAFWDNIAGGRNCISEIPVSRWDTSAYYVEGQAGVGQSNSKWMGVLEGHDRFDPLFFGLSPIEAEAMDPQQRLFLQCCWHGMEDAGYTAERLSGSKCGVFVGCAYGDYNLLSREQQINALGFTGGATSILAARVSYFLNLQGPCVSIDTACSSSLVAIASACDSLVTGASDLALAGGVYVMANADMFLKTAHAGMLSPDGRCYTFDQRANGFVPGEGVGVIMLKRLADAERDGDRILGVLRAWGVNQDGRTNGITAPNAESQQRLIRDVYERFRVDPEDIQLIEAHGTGTKLGDPIEIDGLKSAFRPSTERQGFCAIGSVKTNIGHCLTAAGVSGLIKLLLALKHRKLPPSINFETPNEHLDLAGSPFYVNTTLREWHVPAGGTRHAAISSFGFSGTNAHLVLAEYTPHGAPSAGESLPAAPAPAAGVVIPLSARTPERLRHKALDLREFVQADPGLDLASLACSLQLHRDAMDERLCFVARRAQDVLDGLSAYIDGRAAGAPLPGGVFAGNVRQGRESVRLLSEDPGMAAVVVDKCIADGNAVKLCELWVKGLALEWRKLYGPRKPPMMPLPKYPFADEAYWIVPSGVSCDAAAAPRDDRPRPLHPLLQEKLADLRAQGYRPSSVDAPASDEAVAATPLMHLPTYAFARMRCWIPSKDEVQAGAASRNGTGVAPVARPERFLHNLDSIAELFAELEQDRLSEDEVAARVKQLV